MLEWLCHALPASCAWVAHKEVWCKVGVVPSALTFASAGQQKACKAGYVKRFRPGGGQNVFEFELASVSYCSKCYVHKVCKVGMLPLKH